MTRMTGMASTATIPRPTLRRRCHDFDFVFRSLAHDPQAAGTRAPRSKQETLLLMAYADGELDDLSDPGIAADRARVEALLATDADARALLADMTEIAVSSRQWVREAAAASKVHASVPSSTRPSRPWRARARRQAGAGTCRRASCCFAASTAPRSAPWPALHAC